MTRLTIDLPETLHKTLKSLSVINGKTMRNIAISALEKYVESKIDKQNVNSSSLSESEVDELLRSVLSRYSNQIVKDNFDGKSWDEVKKDLK